MFMAKYEVQIRGNFEEICKKINDEISLYGASMKLIDNSYIELGETKISVTVYDKYYARNSSRASLTLTIAGYHENISISAIGAGGGNGIFFNYSWGAEDDLAIKVKDILRKMGYDT